MKHHFSYHFTRCVGYFFVIFCNYLANVCGDHGKAARCLTVFIQKVADLTWALWNWLISHPRDAINTKKTVQASSMCAPASRCSLRSVYKGQIVGLNPEPRRRKWTFVKFWEDVRPNSQKASPLFGWPTGSLFTPASYRWKLCSQDQRRPPQKISHIFSQLAPETLLAQKERMVVKPSFKGTNSRKYMVWWISSSIFGWWLHVPC